jgi:hypothetical protein
MINHADNGRSWLIARRNGTYGVFSIVIAAGKTIALDQTV